MILIKHYLYPPSTEFPVKLFCNYLIQHKSRNLRELFRKFEIVNHPNFTDLFMNFLNKFIIDYRWPATTFLVVNVCSPINEPTDAYHLYSLLFSCIQHTVYIGKLIHFLPSEIFHTSHFGGFPIAAFI